MKYNEIGADALMRGKTAIALGARKLVFERVANTIEKEIFSGNLRPGDRLASELKLARLFRVSPRSARRALKTLEQKGLVKSLPRQGYFVAGANGRSQGSLSENAARSGNGVQRWAGWVNFTAQLRDIAKKRVPGTNVLRLNAYEFLACLESGMLADLTDLAESVNGGPRLNDIYPELLHQTMRGGRLFGVPLGFSPVVMICNGNVLNSLGMNDPRNGWSRADLLEAARRATVKDDNGVIARSGGMPPPWPLCVWQNGGQVIDLFSCRYTLDTAEAYAGLEFYDKLCRALEFNEFSKLPGEKQNELEMLASGRLLMTHGTLSVLADIRRAHPELRLVVAPEPPGPLPAAWVFMSILAVMRESDEPEQDWLRLSALASPDSQRALYAAGEHYPALISLAESAELLNDRSFGADNRVWVEGLTNPRFLHALSPQHTRMIEENIIDESRTGRPMPPREEVRRFMDMLNRYGFAGRDHAIWRQWRREAVPYVR